MGGGETGGRGAEGGVVMRGRRSGGFSWAAQHVLLLFEFREASFRVALLFKTFSYFALFFIATRAELHVIRDE